MSKHIYDYQLLEAYAAGDLGRAESIIHIHKDSIDIDYVMDYAFWPQCRSHGVRKVDHKLMDEPGKNTVMEYILTEYRDCIRPDIISSVFAELCENEHSLIFFFAKLFTDVLTVDMVSDSISAWASPEFRFKIAETCIDKLSPELFINLVCECCSHHNIDLLERLVDAYPDRMGEQGLCMRLSWSISSPSRVYADIELVQILLRAGSDETQTFLLHEAIRGAALETVRLILDYNPDLLLDPSQALWLACQAEDLDMIDLIIDTIDPSLLESVCIEVFNRSCEEGKDISAKQLLARCGPQLQFEGGFTFEWTMVRQHAHILGLLRDTYGDWIEQRE